MAANLAESEEVEEIPLGTRKNNIMRSGFQFPAYLTKVTATGAS